MSDAAKREEQILAFWNEHKIFEKSLAKDAPQGEYVFYDGPPFATGLPHYGHIVASVIKDVVPRYFTMRGYRVPRQWGWDCHGLPIENIVEKELGFKHKKDILNFGVAEFNERCRSKVLVYADEWKKVIPRIGRWADMDAPYFTMSRDFMESVWWAFKQLYEKGLVYEDYRSMHICPRCETTLSQTEVTEGYKEVKDLAVTVKFKLKNPEKIGLSGDVYMLAWTTTPWTLPGNVALAVGKNINYRVSEFNGEKLIASSESLLKEEMFRTDPSFQAVKNVKGSELVGLEYQPPFDYYVGDPTLKNRENGWKVYPADFVTAESGTGIAHEAPAFGADDWELAKKFNIPFVQHVKMDGTFKPEVKDFPGADLSPRAKNIPEEVREVDLDVKKYLEQKNLLFASEKYLHTYPHCWRCDTPLLNYATSSWFVNIEGQKEALLRNAKPINWSPAHIKEGRWGKWLEGARDWSISRQRFWASVMPVWRCEACNKTRVFGSVAELEKASGKKIDDLHKHIVDEIMVSCDCLPTQPGRGLMKRIPDVLDTWFDSGSMPYGQRHYPFENKARFESTFPAQFIAEGQDQTRAWFYYLHVLATSIFDKHAFENVIVNGIVLAEDGKKMSKKLQNYPDPMEVVEKYSADALRLYLLASPVMQAENLNFSEKGVAEWKSVLTRLENVLSFYQLYQADASHEPSGASAHVLDRWIITRMHQVHADMTKALDTYNLTAATRPLALFVDDLSTWYLRRSRDRIKGTDEKDKTAALSTTLFILRETATLMAPLSPFIAEHVWQQLRSESDVESVHLAAWPSFTKSAESAAQKLKNLFGKQDTLLADMAAARAIVSKALEARDNAKIKVRQPLQALEIPRLNLDENLLVLIKEEVNVKEIIENASLTQGVRLDTTMTDALREEGMLRDIVRDIQALRKESKLNPKDRGTYHVDPSQGTAAFIEKHREYLQKETNTDIVFDN